MNQPVNTAPAANPVPERKPPAILAAIQSVKAALASAGVGKDRRNTEQNFQFRGIDDILNALAPLMATHQMAVFPAVEDAQWSQVETNNGKKVNRVTMKIRFVFTSLIDGSSINSVIPSEASDYSDKATNKAISFALKYACITVFCIPVVGNEDGDFQSVGNEAEGSAPATASAAPAAAAKKSSKKKTAEKDAAPAGDNAVVTLLNSIDKDSASKVAELIRKAYKLKLISDIPAGDPRIPEILKRIADYQEAKKKAATAAPAAASTPATSSDIPE